MSAEGALGHVRLARGLLLYEQHRYEQALLEFQAALADWPEDSMALAYCALALVRLERFAEATETGHRAVAADPDEAFAHYALAVVYSERNQALDAERSIDRALDLDPEDPSLFGTAAMIRLSRKKWEEAADLAGRGLELDPGDSLCLNARSMALAQMGRVEDARHLLAGDLQEDPENPLTLANLGWAALRAGDREQALQCFREALRNDPEMEYARTGLLEALRLRYPLYGLFLRYFLWMGSLPAGTQWGILIGGYIGFRLLKGLGRSSPEWQPWIVPLLVLYGLFAYFTWTARPFVNLLLLLNPYGRAALRDEDRTESWLAAACLAGAAGFGGTALAVGSGAAGLAALVCLTLVIPVAAVGSCSRGWPRRVMAALAGGLALVGLGGAAVLGAGGGPGLLVVYFVAFFLSQWVANFLMSVEPRR